MSEVEAVAERVGIIRRGQVVEVAETAALRGRSLRHATVRFKRPVDWSALTDLVGVSTLANGDPTEVSLQVEGDMEVFVRALGAFPVADLETVRPSLEELFLAYYQ
jgi:ABC-2 type transport system ATP-binding protein